MSDGNFQHELGDELLSAYLDGELAPAERAAVEARLASDPGAKQMLHQLRVVSQSVQALPTVGVGRDLRDEILRRVEALKPAAHAASTSADGKSFRPLDLTPTGTLFQSRRPWIWASLALAAGLLIMFMQAGGPKNKDLPVAAQASREPTNVRRKANDDLSSPTTESSALGVDPAKVAKTEPLLQPPAAMPSASGGAGPPVPMSAEGRLSTQVSDLDKLTPDGKTVVNSPAASPPIPGPSTMPSSTTPDTSGAVAGAAGAPVAPVVPSDVPTDAEIRAGKVPLGGRFVSPAPANRADAPPVAASEPAPSARGGGGGPGGFKGPFGADSKSTFAGGAPTQPAPAAAAPPSPELGVALGRAAPLAEAKELALGETANELVIVRVVAKADAIQNKAFEKLLVKNGVELEASPESGGEKAARAAGASEKLSDRAADGEHDAQRLLKARASGDDSVDLVLVQAPESAIASCLTDLKKDTANYISLAVHDTAAGQDRTDVNRSFEKKSALDFSQYSRGFIAEDRKDRALDRDDYRYRALVEDEKAALDQDGKNKEAESAAKPVVAEAAKKVAEAQPTTTRGRARRLIVQPMEDEKADKFAQRGAFRDESSVAHSTKQSALQPKSKSLERVVAGNLQVLFVVSPERATTLVSPATREPATPTPGATTEKPSK